MYNMIIFYNPLIIFVTSLDFFKNRISLLQVECINAGKRKMKYLNSRKHKLFGKSSIRDLIPFILLCDAMSMPV